MEIAASVLELVGRTPMVRLARFDAGLACPIVVKQEAANPGGSVKDRAALAMIDAAERDGLLQPGQVILERTSGNTGVGLAMVAAHRGYRCVCVMTTKAAPEKVALLRAYGAEVRSLRPDIEVVGADPEGSIYSGQQPASYLVEGLGEDFWPATFDPSVVDRWELVGDEESFAVAREVTRTEGLLVGGSCGTALAAARRVAAGATSDALVVVVLPDSGRRYLSKVFDDDWLIDQGLGHLVDGSTRP